MNPAVSRHAVRIGCVGGRPRRVNERAIDGEWAACLADYANVVSIPPLRYMKLFGGSLERWKRRLPDSLMELAERLREMCRQYRIEAMYVNLPVILPYLMMARNEAGLKLSFVCIAHSIASEFWLKQWIGIAPLLTSRDVLLVSSSSSLQAMLNISPVYRQATLLPLCIRIPETAAERLPAPGDLRQEASGRNDRRNILALGRLESVKNVHILLRCFAAMADQMSKEGIRPHLYLAGEYTGPSTTVIDAYREQLESLIDRFELRRHVTFTGPVTGQAKEQLLRSAHLLVNLSTDPGETFGYNLLEAKVAGLPVVCTAWDGFRDIVADGIEGTLVSCSWDEALPAFDEAEVSRACTSLLLDGERWQRYSRNTRQCAEQFDHRRIMPRIIEAVERAQRQSMRTEPSDWRSRCFDRPVRMQADLYRLPALAMLPLLDRTPADILSLEDSGSSEWTSWVKPVIAHYGRSMHDAKL